MVTKLLIILGPTCTGKTSLALKLCARFNGAIVSADSRQVVRYMDLGTGKVPVDALDQQIEKRTDRWLMNGIDIYGYDLVNPDDYFSAFDFADYCGKLFPAISRSNKNIFIVGGTGFYIDALTGRMPLAGIGPDMKLRGELEKLSLEDLATKLLELDEPAYQKIDRKNPARLIRAIERSTQVDSLAKTIPVVRDAVFVGLTADREILYSRADRWVAEIFGEQLFAEVKQIQTQFPKSLRLNGLIYKSVVDYLTGAATLEEAKQRAKFDMHAYIRRQQTWFKRTPGIAWFDISQKNFDAGVSSLVESELHGQR